MWEIFFDITAISIKLSQESGFNFYVYSTAISRKPREEKSDYLSIPKLK